MEIKKLLDKEFCAKIVQSASLIIGCDVLITDETGRVLASSDPSRVGSLHEASLSVIASGRQAYHDRGAASRLSGTMPGTTIPLTVEERVIGTIGITGSPEEISKYALLIQQLSQLFLSFRGRQEASTRTNYQKQGLLREIIGFDQHTSDLTAIQCGAYELGVDLNTPRVVLLIRAVPTGRPSDSGAAAVRRSQVPELLAELFNAAQDFICVQSDTEYVVMTALSACGSMGLREEIMDQCRRLTDMGERGREKISIGVGSPAESIETLKASYRNARFALKVLDTRSSGDNCLFIDDVVLEKLAVNLPDDVCAEVADEFFRAILQAKNGEETMLLVDCWCRQGFHFSRTAEALHVHKSTLVYRFRRIQELFGLNLYDFDKVLALHLLHMRRQIES